MNEQIEVVSEKTLPVSLINDMTIPYQLMGGPSLLNPLLQHTTSQRGAMDAASWAQAPVIRGSEFPRLASGWELIFGDHEFDMSSREEDVQIFAVIPKFDQVGIISPSYTVIYHGMETGKMGCFTVENYTMLHNHYGYFNKLTNRHLMTQGSLVNKDVKFSTAPNHNGVRYCMGTNVQLAVMTHFDVPDDAFMISESVAKDLGFMSFIKVKTTLTEHDMLRNLFGHEGEHLCFPDIGQPVGDEGVLFSIFRINPLTGIFDLQTENLQQISHMHDRKYPVESVDARVVDVDVFMPPSVQNRLSRSNGAVYQQFLKYKEMHDKYYRTIAMLEPQCRDYQLTPQLNDLLTTAMLMSPEKGSNQRSKFIDKDEPLNFITFTLTYAFERTIDRGFKLTGRNGDKGVFSRICPEEDMPIDDFGIRAGLVRCTSGTTNRMNLAVSFEQSINRSSHIMWLRLLDGKLGDDDQAYATLMEYIHDVNPTYAQIIQQGIDKNPILRIPQFVDTVREEGIFIIRPPMHKDRTPALVKMLAEKWKTRETQVNYVTRYPDENGNIEVVNNRTIAPVCIGPIFVKPLGKVPILQASAVEMAYVNQNQLPVKPISSDTKSRHLLGKTAIRIGEDDTFIQGMSIGIEVLARQLAMVANCPEAVKRLCTLLASSVNPSDIQDIGITTEHMLQNCMNLAIVYHKLSAIGIDLSDEKDPK